MKRNVHFMLILSMLLLYYGITGVYDQLSDNSDLIETEGRIIALLEKNPSKGAALHPIVSFSDEAGNELTFISRDGSNFYKSKVGEAVKVIYPSGYPEEARIKGSAAAGMAPGIFLISGTVLFILWFGEAYKNFK